MMGVFGAAKLMEIERGWRREGRKAGRDGMHCNGEGEEEEEKEGESKREIRGMNFLEKFAA